MAPPARVFVYGTLMPGETRWPALQPFAASWSAGTAHGRLWDSGRGYPVARFHADDPVLPGVVVVLRPGCVEEALRVLDAIEGQGVLYRRVNVATSAGPALSYEWMGPTDGLPPLPHGWAARSGGSTPS